MTDQPASDAVLTTLVVFVPLLWAGLVLVDPVRQFAAGDVSLPPGHELLLHGGHLAVKLSLPRLG